MRVRLSFFVIICSLEVTALAGVVRGDCHTFFGISTCDDKDELLEYPFSIPWWFVNSLHHVRSIQKTMLHLESTLVGLQVRHSPKYVQDMWSLAKTDAVERFQKKVVESFQEKGEPIDLLLDENMDFIILSQSFRKHYQEIFNFIQEFIASEELDDDLRRVGHIYTEYIKYDEVMLRFAPDPTKSTIFELFRRGVKL